LAHRDLFFIIQWLLSHASILESQLTPVMVGGGSDLISSEILY